MLRLVSLCLVSLVLSTGCIEKMSRYRLIETVPSDLKGFSNALYQSTQVKLAGGHQIELANNGSFFDVLAEQLKQAKQSINIVVFIWRPGEPSDRLVPIIVERARAGVACRILVDHVGSMDFEKGVQPQLAAAGCQVDIFRKLTENATVDRNHRKIFVIDGKVGFTGGVGIDKNWLGDGVAPDQWRDSNVRVRGPAVAQMQQAFAENWLEQTGTFLPEDQFPPMEAAGDTLAAFVTSTGNPQLTRAERLTQLMIAAATKRVWIANAYFMPSPGLTELITRKAQAGVDVRVMTPSDSTDHKEILAMQRRRYDELKKAGVKVFEYQPTMFHPKTMVVDDHLAIIGSINLDKLSQDWLEEGSLVVYDVDFVKALVADWNKDIEHCKAVVP